MVNAAPPAAVRAPVARTRERLNRHQVVTAAVALAQEGGIDSLTMRNLGRELGVVPMAIYKHVANKADLLDLMVEEVFREIEFATDAGWRRALRERAISLREALQRHPWAIGLTEAGTFGSVRLEHHEKLMRCLRRDAGLSFPMALHAFSLIDSLVYGFALQQKALAGRHSGDEAPTVLLITQKHPPAEDEYPYVAELMTNLGRSGYDYREEFEFGLDAVLDSIERLREHDLALSMLAPIPTP